MPVAVYSQLVKLISDMHQECILASESRIICRIVCVYPRVKHDRIIQYNLVIAVEDILCDERLKHAHEPTEERPAFSRLS